MSHKFEGTWNYYQIAETGFNPGRPEREGDFVLIIADNGTIDPRRSTVDGRTVVSGTATNTTVEIIAVGRKYHGHIIKETILGGYSAFVLAGRHKDVATGLRPTDGSERITKKGDKATAQDEGTWVLTKP